MCQPTQVICRKIPICIKNLKNPHGSGTVIDPEADSKSETPQHDNFGFGTTFVSWMLRNRTINGIGGMQCQQVLMAVMIKECIVMLNMQLN
jgi:aspartokinase